MKRTLMVIIGLLNLSGMLYCQFSSFNLSDFKLPDIRRNQLEITLASEFSQYKSIQERLNDTIKRHGTSFSDNSEVNYSSFINTEKYQGNRILSFGLRPDWSSYKLNEELVKENHFDPFFSLSSANRFYNSNKFFFEAGLSAWGSQYGYKKTSDFNDLSEKTKRSSIGFEIPLATGYGRIEPVQDARLAVYILEELQKAGKLAMVPDNNQITEFANFIATLKNERYFDYRLRRMEEIEKVDSFMQARGWVNKADARYYTTVYDNWEYADGPVRESGKRLSAGIKPYFNIQANYNRTDQNNSATNNYSDRDGRLGMEIFAFFVFEKPVNLHWQKGWSARISYASGKNHHSEKDKIADVEYTDSFIEHILSGNVRYTIGYFPNSRTSLYADIHANGGNQRYVKSNNWDVKNRLYIHPGISLQMEYYISERSGLSLIYNASYNAQTTEYASFDYKNKTSDIGHFAHIHFTYKIF